MKEVMFKRAGFLMTFFTILSTVLAIAQENPAIKQARLAIYHDQPAKAVTVLSDAVKANPEDASLLYYLGRAQIMTGQNKEAEINFQKGLDMNAKEYLNLAGKGHLRIVENNTAEGKQLLDQALASSKSKNNAVLRAVGDAFLASDKFTNEALTALNKAKSNGDTDPYTYILLGDANAKLGKGGDAVSAYEKAASLDPKNGFPHYKIGVVYFRAKNNAVAEESLIKATTVDPSSLLAFKELGEFYYVQKQYTKAVKAHESYMALLDKSDVKKAEDAEFKEAFYRFSNKEYAKANAIFDNLMKKPDASCNVYKYRFYSKTETAKSGQGDAAAAQSAWDDFVGKCPNEIAATDWIYLGRLQQFMKQDTVAASSFGNALRLEPNQPELQQEVAEIWFNAKNYKNAVAAYRALKKVKPKLAAKDLFTMGKAFYADTTWVSADSAFLQVIEAAPNMTVGYQWEARTKAALDPSMKQGLAKPYFEKLIEKALENPEKYKKELIESYRYMGGYQLLVKNDYSGAKQWIEKALALNPDPNEKKDLESVKQAINDAIKAQQQQKKGGQR